MNEWSNFYVATASAAAALTGLIFVGVSINLTKILSIKTLPERALLSLTLLLSILILSLLSLVPQSLNYLGIEILFLTIGVWLFVVRLDAKILRRKDNKHQRHYIGNTVLNQIAVLPYFIGSIIILSHGNAGVYWIVAAFIFSFIKAVLDAWVLLVEINR